MNLLEGVRLALRALTTNKLRSALTMLGIIIGVGAVITLMSVGEGVQSYITAQFEAIGTNLFFLVPGSFQEELRRPAFITTRDAEAIADPAQAPSVLHVAPVVQGSASVTTPGRDRGVTVTGVTPEYALARDWQTQLGQFVTAADNQSRARVAVLGASTASYFFPDRPDPTGEVIRVNGSPFRVIGVPSERGGSSFQNEDDVVMIPLNTALSRVFPRRTTTGEPSLTIVYVQAVSEERMDAAIEEVSLILRQRHRIGLDEPDDFTAISQSDIIGTFPADHGRADGLPGRHRRDQPARGRDRHHEHYVGLGHRANARNRPTKGRRSTQARHSLAVLDRSRDALDVWGRRRYTIGCCRRVRHLILPERRRILGGLYG